MSPELCAEMLGEIFEDHEVEIPLTKIEAIAKEVCEGFEMDAEVRSYQFAGPSSESTKVKDLERALERERTKRICEKCNGSGREVSYGGTLRFESSCYFCDGGFVYLGKL